jgi:hypothetical protein
MVDILERLQGPRTPQGGSWPYPNLHDEAADEIKILRGQVEALDNERSWLWTEKLRMQLEITRLKEMVQNAYYEGWQDNASREYSRQEINRDWETSEACAAIREGGKNEN